MKSIQKFLDSVGLKKGLQIQPIAQDASERRFYRIVQAEKSFVLMEIVNPHPIVSAPVKLYHSFKDELPYVNIGRYLAHIGVPVPKIIEIDRHKRFILLEDAGKYLLSEIIGQRPDLVRTLYRKAIEILVKLQAGSVTSPDLTCFAFQMEFGYPIIRWELEHFLEFGIEKRASALPSAVRTALESELDSLARAVDSIPKILMHRDYHARNLVVNDSGNIGVTDFQDALLGPETYDIASLLFDAYIELNERLKIELVQYYLELRRSSGLAPRDFNDFYEQIKLTALQRLLKIIGRFVYLAQEKGKAGFLNHMPRVINSVMSLLEELPQMERLKILVKPYLEEKNG